MYWKKVFSLKFSAFSKIQFGFKLTFHSIDTSEEINEEKGLLIIKHIH